MQFHTLRPHQPASPTSPLYVKENCDQVTQRKRNGDVLIVRRHPVYEKESGRCVSHRKTGFQCHIALRDGGVPEWEREQASALHTRGRRFHGRRGTTDEGLLAPYAVGEINLQVRYQIM